MHDPDSQDNEFTLTLNHNHGSKAVVIVSGGLDSATLLLAAIKEYGSKNVYTITFHYGQKHSKEVDYASKLITKYVPALNGMIVDVSALAKLTASRSALTSQTITVPQLESIESKDEQVLKSTVVPFRNAVFLSMAVSYANSIGASDIMYGAHYSDKGIYPDCRAEFVYAFEKAVRLGTDDNKISISAPFVNLTKGQVVSIGNKLGVPFVETWSCYKGEKIHCGKCPSCLERKRAFKEAKVYDPTDYESS